MSTHVDPMERLILVELFVIIGRWISYYFQCFAPCPTPLWFWIRKRVRFPSMQHITVVWKVKSAVLLDVRRRIPFHAIKGRLVLNLLGLNDDETRMQNQEKERLR